ncbi:MAG: replication and repair protein RecF protein [candidate division TM6 bacterium GW2011_GWF2_28_16]|nr:MAG: replication and repair protein RecF protein [candidate division TM6 bacterium GW2011_GWF2_28_16]
MIINNLKLQNFRCFSDLQLSFNDKIIVLQGDNGSGKTSILESLYYACYLRSFRTRTKSELVSFAKDHFFIQVDFQEQDLAFGQIQIGFSSNTQKSVKLNKKSVNNFKEIISRYKVIALSEDDLQLIIGAPEVRRAYLNQSLFLISPDLIDYFKEYKKNLDQRNKFLFLNSKNKIISAKSKEELYSWTKQLWEKSVFLQEKRELFLKQVEDNVNLLLNKYFKIYDPELSIELVYNKKNMLEPFDSFWQYYETKLLEGELRFQRSLFGIHLDDFSINFKKKKARFFASRGQQKLVLFLLKIVQLLQIQGFEPGVLLLDDFITDFDINRLSGAISLLKDQEFQTIISCPIDSFFEKRIDSKIFHIMLKNPVI